MGLDLPDMSWATTPSPFYTGVTGYPESRLLETTGAHDQGWRRREGIGENELVAAVKSTRIGQAASLTLTGKKTIF